MHCRAVIEIMFGRLKVGGAAQLDTTDSPKPSSLPSLSL
tara:strand:- start:478 stop:594 length:117 start_codon:yes stop_codon:yes gene_type:complete